MQKKLLRLAVGVFTFAVASASAPKTAAAFLGGCPGGANIKFLDTWAQCNLITGDDCSMCLYDCGDFGPTWANMCLS
jgi:hypothetical protein